jgi:hypothetical protein
VATRYGSSTIVKDVKRRYLRAAIEATKDDALKESLRMVGDGVSAYTPVITHSVSTMPHPNDNETVTIIVSVVMYFNFV